MAYEPRVLPSVLKEMCMSRMQMSIRQQKDRQARLTENGPGGPLVQTGFVFSLWPRQIARSAQELPNSGTQERRV